MHAGGHALHMAHVFMMDLTANTQHSVYTGG